jgi:hypothetical protein
VWSFAGDPAVIPTGLAPGDRRFTACSGRPTKSLEGTVADQNFRMEIFDDETAPAPTAEELANLPKVSTTTSPSPADLGDTVPAGSGSCWCPSS